MDKAHGATDKGTAKGRRCACQKSQSHPRSPWQACLPLTSLQRNRQLTRQKFYFLLIPSVEAHLTHPRSEKSPTTSNNQEHPHEGVLTHNTSVSLWPGEDCRHTQRLLPTSAEGSCLAVGTFTDETHLSALPQFQVYFQLSSPQSQAAGRVTFSAP